MRDKILFSCLLWFVLWGECGTAVAAPLYRVVATTGMISDLARQIAGERAEIKVLMVGGVDPHLYKPTRFDIAALNRADIVFYNGLLLEGKMTGALQRLAENGRRVFAVTEQIKRSYLFELPEMIGHYDPHVWMDPVAWTKAAEVIRDRLSEYDPEGRVVYEENARVLIGKLAAFDAYAQRVLSSVPPAKRVLVTAHDAFNYFGRRYDYHVVGIQGLSTESEAGVQDVERIIAVLVERSIPAVFVETTVSSRNIQALIQGAAAQGKTVRLGGSLFSDAMGKPGTYRGTYLGMIDHNVTTISRALGGDAPEHGFQGMLNREE